jgi:alpha-L-rhamnosidase
VRLLDASKLPCIYIDSPHIKTNSTWLVSNGTGHFVPAGSMPEYCSPKADPCVFPFKYEHIEPVSTEKSGKGILYDFGHETFCTLSIKNVSSDNVIFVNYGESKEEAMDTELSTLKEKVSGKRSYLLKARAFRYIWIKQSLKEDYTLNAKYEYIPLKDNGTFSCEDPNIKKIWDICSYTFHLNSREFYLDGIKRDRWVWSGDSCQSFLINRYLYFDPEIIKRTILCLLGKPPYEQHINTINDYSLYLLISIWDYYFSTGDKAFLSLVFPRAKALYQFIIDRLDKNGLMVERPGDWVFIDWSPIDKSGPISAEQILLWQTERAMGWMSAVLEEDSGKYLSRAKKLKSNIMSLFWDPKKHAFIDTYSGNRRNVSRHANIFAIMYDFVDLSMQKDIMKYVLDNNNITQITTPYFKLYELIARCKLGDVSSAQNMLTSYWGKMLNLGATTIWEQFDPNVSMADHYAMYGDKYGCSLCHAWGSGPIYLLGRFCLGVYPTAVGYKEFTVRPNTGLYKEIHGSVPLPNGKVYIDYKDRILNVLATCSGGVLIVGKKKYILKASEKLTVKCSI